MKKELDMLTIAIFCNEMRDKYKLTPEEWFVLQTILVVQEYLKKSPQLMKYVVGTHAQLGHHTIINIIKSRIKNNENNDA